MASPAPGIEATTLSKHIFSLEAAKGKVVLVDFWATWCPPCRQSLKSYSRFHHEFADAGLEIVAISSEEKLDTIESFVAELALPFHVIHDAEGRIAAEFNPPTMPTAYLVDQQGQIIETFVGFKEGDETRIRAAINRVLGGDTVLPSAPIQVLPTQLNQENQSSSYRYWSYGLWSTGAVLLGAGGYLWLGPMQESIEERDKNYTLWQNTAPSPQFESFEKAFVEAEERATRQRRWGWILAGAGLTSVIAGFVTWFAATADGDGQSLSQSSGIQVNLMPRLNDHAPGLNLHLTW
jgi:YD repeat-containing protein